MFLNSADILRLLLAVLVGGLIGAEREYRVKAAGFRTHIFICIGATLFTIISIRLGRANDAVRIAANIVTGVGFLGAGAIFQSSGRVSGLTTASTIWLVAALGMGIGGGLLLISGIATIVMLMVLLIFPRLEVLIDRTRRTCTYEVTCLAGPGKLKELDDLITSTKLRIHERSRAKLGDRLVCTWSLSGPPQAHEILVNDLLLRQDILELKA